MNGTLHRRNAFMIVQAFTNPRPRPGRTYVTGREAQVLVGAAYGLRNADIADALGINVNTVKAHLRHACQRLGAADRTHAVALAVAAGIIPIQTLPRPTPGPDRKQPP